MRIPFVLLSLILFCCKNPEVNKIEINSNLKNELDNSFSPIWTIKADSVNSSYKLYKLKEVNIYSFSPDKLTGIINNTYIHYRTVFMKTSRDTIYMLIPAGKILKEKFGENLLNHFLMTSTYTLTELKKIKYVSFEIESFDEPTTFKVFSRNSW